ncbi:MAG: putative signal transducing protein [Acidobacteriota bacterium]
MTDLVVVATYLTGFDADLARTALEAAGVDCMVRADDCGGLRPHLWMGGVELLVRDEDRERAEEVLGSIADERDAAVVREE